MANLTNLPFLFSMFLTKNLVVLDVKQHPMTGVPNKHNKKLGSNTASVIFTKLPKMSWSKGVNKVNVA